VSKIEQGKRIQEARESIGLSQGKMAAVLGVSRPTLIAWEKGANPPPAVKLALIGDITNFSGNYLLHGEEPRMRSGNSTLEERILAAAERSARAMVAEIQAATK
jgi:transcriptional regulator with XRE-family HTH domain